MSENEHYAAVSEAVANALGVDDDEVTPDATLMDDLGAESIDLLDILFRIERATGVKIQASDLGDEIQGGIPDDEFGGEDEIVTRKGLDHLTTVMPQISPDEYEGKLRADEVIQHFTVQNLSDMVARRAAA
jgi:acyl carrier protein